MILCPCPPSCTIYWPLSYADFTFHTWLWLTLFPTLRLLSSWLQTPLNLQRPPSWSCPCILSWEKSLPWLHFPPFHGLCPFPPQCPLAYFCSLGGLWTPSGLDPVLFILCPLHHIALLEIGSQQTYLRQLKKHMAQQIYLASSDFTFLGWEIWGRGLLWSDHCLFCLCAEALMCTLQPDSLCTLHMYPHSLGSCLGCVCVCVGGYGGSPVPSDGWGGWRWLSQGKISAWQLWFVSCPPVLLLGPTAESFITEAAVTGLGAGTEQRVYVWGGWTPLPESLSCQRPEPSLWPWSSPPELWRRGTSCNSPSQIYPCTQRQHCMIGRGGVLIHFQTSLMDEGHIIGLIV